MAMTVREAGELAVFNLPLDVPRVSQDVNQLEQRKVEGMVAGRKKRKEEEVNN